MNFITIDCGASFIKGAYIQDGKIIKKMQKKTPAVHGKESILNPKQIQVLIQLVQQMIKELAGDAGEIKLCISNEMHGFLLAYENGTPFTDYISWQHEFGVLAVNNCTAMQLLQNTSLNEELLFTGMPLRAGLPSCNLLYLYLKGHLNKAIDQLYFYTLGDYILKIISNREPMSHPTNAAATGLYDLRKDNWNDTLVKKVSGEHVIFPVVGKEEITFEIGSLKIHAIPAIGDQQAALLGSGLDTNKALSFNLGTGAQVSKVVSDLACSKEYQIRPYFYGQYLKTLPHLPSGRALNVYIRFFKDILNQFGNSIEDDLLWKTLLAAEQKENNSEIICDLSFFENPLTNHKVGSITNIEEYSLSLGSVMHAILSQMGMNFIQAAEIIEPNSSDVKQIIFSGGVARKIEKIRKYILQHYNKNIEVKVTSDETLFGLYRYGIENERESMMLKNHAEEKNE